MRTSATESKYSAAVVKPGKLYAVQCHIYQEQEWLVQSWGVGSFSFAVMQSIDK
tara:strand:- start:283 stop:444 length:162 start_codon:yes stop_codon:yes gene_type:complete